MLRSTPPSYIELPATVFDIASASPRDELSSPFQTFYTAPSSPLIEAPPETLQLTSLHNELTNMLSKESRPASPPDESFPVTSDLPIDMTLDDEGLSSLEKIYLFSRSKAIFHRIFIAHALPSFLEQITAIDAVQYVLPLLSGLAMDEDDTVKEAFAAELVPVIWWFFTHCQIVLDDLFREDDPFPSEFTTVPISVQAFTPILGTFLLSQNANVSAAARYAVVDLLSRIHEVNKRSGSVHAELQSLEDTDESVHYVGLFGTDERQMFENEILQQVVVGMGRLESSFDEEEPEIGSAWPAHPSEHSSDSTVEAEGGITPEIGITPNHTDDMAKNAENSSPFPPVLSTSLTIASPASSASSSTPSSISDTSSSDSSPSTAASALNQLNTKTASNISPSHGTRIPVPPPDRPDYFAIPQGSGSESNPFHIFGSDIPLPSTPSDEWRKTTVKNSDTENENSKSFADSVSPPASRPSHAALPTPSQIQPAPEELIMESDDEQQAAVGRLSSLSLMAAVTASGFLGDYMKNVFVAEVERVGHDPVYWVRREVSFTLGALAKVVPEEVVLISLLPIFHSLRKDPTSHVRHSALFALPAILSRLSPSKRRALALETIVTLSTDVSGTVRSAVIESLGEVLHTFRNDDGGPPEELVRLFMGRKDDKRVRDGQQQRDADAALVKLRHDMLTSIFGLSNSAPSRPPPPVDDPQELFFTDPARPSICAFNYPAVALTLGRKRWTGEFRQVYLDLAENPTIEVRRTLAASLAELAKIVGPEHARKDLVPVWWHSVRCEEEAVRIKALECVSAFVEVLSDLDETTESIIGGLWTVWQEGIFSGWRERQTIGNALASLVKLVSYRHSNLIRQLLCSALEDNVAAVREAATSSLSTIWTSYASQPELQAELNADLQTLLDSELFKKRMTFIACQQALIVSVNGQSAIIPDDAYWQRLSCLAADPILGVRIGLARLAWIASESFGHANSSLSALTRRLSDDSSHEVRSFVAFSNERQGENRHPNSKGGAQLSTFSRPPPTTTVVNGI